MSLESTAHHEAGHGVMAVMLGGTVAALSMNGSEDRDIGSAQVIWPGTKELKAILVDDIKTALAGPLSEMVYCGDYDYLRIQSEHAVDWQIISSNLERLELAPSSQGAFLQSLIAEVYEAIRATQVWSAIGDIAELLMLHDVVDGQTVHECTAFWLRR